MPQSYTFLHKINENENILMLNFAKSNNLKVLLAKRKAAYNMVTALSFRLYK